MWGGFDSRSADLGARFGRGWSELRNPVPEEKQAGVRVHLRRKECIMTQIRMTLIAGMEVAEAIATNSVAGALIT